MYTDLELIKDEYKFGNFKHCMDKFHEAMRYYIMSEHNLNRKRAAMVEEFVFRQKENNMNEYFEIIDFAAEIVNCTIDLVAEELAERLAGIFE